MTETLQPTRDFTVAVFVVHEDHLVLHFHRKLQKWLPPGGHIEPNELPDDAARREVHEETGLLIELVGPKGLPVDHPGEPRQLVIPAGIQLEPISPGHEHIDLVYFARPVRTGSESSLPMLDDSHGARWIPAADLTTIDLGNEVRLWCERAVRELAID
jgi:8-oxo-dGTP pyrophosphatase MutT (NUDIX family)